MTRPFLWLLSILVAGTASRVFISAQSASPNRIGERFQQSQVQRPSGAYIVERRPELEPAFISETAKSVGFSMDAGPWALASDGRFTCSGLLAKEGVIYKLDAKGTATDVKEITVSAAPQEGALRPNEVLVPFVQRISAPYKGWAAPQPLVDCISKQCTQEFKTLIGTVSVQPFATSASRLAGYLIHIQR